MNIGSKVRLKQDGEVYTVGSKEFHNTLWFYRLNELPGSLFLASSLEEAD